MSDALKAAIPCNVDEERLANPPRFCARFICFGNMPHYRDPKCPVGHAHNPVPPGKSSEPDWMAKLRERMRLEEDRQR